jgi:hypothetical protein
MQFRPTKTQLQAKDSKRVRKAWGDPYLLQTKLCGTNAFGIAEIAKGLFSCAEQSRVLRSESPRAA